MKFSPARKSIMGCVHKDARQKQDECIQSQQKTTRIWEEALWNRISAEKVASKIGQD